MIDPGVPRIGFQQRVPESKTQTSQKAVSLRHLNGKIIDDHSHCLPSTACIGESTLYEPLNVCLDPPCENYMFMMLADDGSKTCVFAYGITSFAAIMLVLLAFGLDLFYVPSVFPASWHATPYLIVRAARCHEDAWVEGILGATACMLSLAAAAKIRALVLDEGRRARGKEAF